MNGAHLSRAIDHVSTLQGTSSSHSELHQTFVQLGHLSWLAAMADALIDVVICSVEGFCIPSVRRFNSAGVFGTLKDYCQVPVWC